MFAYRIVRNAKEKIVTIKRGFSICACYNGEWWKCSDEEIFEDFLHNYD